MQSAIRSTVERRAVVGRQWPLLQKTARNKQLTPSTVLNHMKNLNNNQCCSAVLKSLFIEQLSDSHKAILTAINE